MKVHLGVLFICIISKFNHAKEDDIEQEHIERFGSTILEKFDGITLTNASNVSSGHFRIRTRRQLKGGRCKGCGLANIPRGPRTSIIMGDDVRPPYKYPWTVAIRTEGKISCTGSIINEYFILTAAHCFKRDVHNYEALKPTKKRVPYLRPSEVSIEILKKAGPPVRRIIPHIRFTVSKWRNDIALLQLKRRIICSRFTRPICLPPRNIVIPSQAILRIAGFGSDLGQGEAIDHLKEAKVRLVDIDTCSYSSHLKDGNYYCVNSARKDQTLCYGDSGGPMVYRLGNKFYQIGVASMGKQCDVDEPFLYTSVPMHLNWIYKSMRHFRGKVNSGKVIRGRVHSDTEADDAVPFDPDSGEAVNSGETVDSGDTVYYEEADVPEEDVDYGDAVDYEEADVPENAVDSGDAVDYEEADVPEEAVDSGDAVDYEEADVLEDAVDSGDAVDYEGADVPEDAVDSGDAVDYEGADVPEEAGVPEGAGVNEGAGVPEGVGVHEEASGPEGAGIQKGPGVHEGPGVPERASAHEEACVPEGAGVHEVADVNEGADVSEGVDVPKGAGVAEGAGVPERTGIPEEAGVHEGAVSEVRLEAVGSGMADRGDNDDNYGLSKLSRPKKCVSNT